MTTPVLAARLRLLLVIVLPLIAAVLVTVMDAGRPLDNWLRTQRNELRRHPASGQIVVVEIDAESLARFRRWPWPRSIYGTAVDRASAAGADTIAFDVDFSSASTPAEDARFVEAVSRSQAMVVLPTFRQNAAVGSSREVENLPIPSLREHVFLGSVNVFTDRDGVLRNYRPGITTDGEVRPSLASYLAASPGQAARDFRIDYSIDPATVPRYSFADLVEGRIGADKLAGKRMLIGATAIELGDRYASPGYGILPGVYTQALAAETLLQKAAKPTYGPWLGLLLGLAAGFALLMRSRLRQAAALAATAIGMVGLPLLFEHLRLGGLDAAPGLAFLVAAALGALVCETLASFHKTRLTDADSGLPNRAAFAVEPCRPGMMVVSAAFAHADDLASIIGPSLRGEVIARIADKLSVASRGARLFRMEAGRYAWIASTADAAELERDLQLAANLLKEPITVGEQTLLLRPSFGWAEVVAQTGLAGAYTQASLAGQRAAQTNTPFMAYDPRMAEAAARAQQLLADIVPSIEAGHFWVAYQPKLDLKTHTVVGAEALVRWRHPQLGPVGPDEFIPLVESEGAITEITWFVIDRVLADMIAWAGAGLMPSVAVNVSTRLFDDGTFAAALIARTAAAGVEAGQVTVEVTESATVGSAETTIAELQTLRAAGFKISVDDYGTGQSTLTYLRNFPAHEIKIDQAFIRKVTHQAADQILVRSTIDLAHALKLSVVAEGIEDQETLDLLRDMGCEIGQGWAIGKPMPAEAFIETLKSRPAEPERLAG